MPGFFDWISSGISTAVQPVTNWLNDTRADDLTRSRIASVIDPAQTIDATNSGTSILSFPADRPKYYMTFGFEEYQRPNQFSGLRSSGVKDYICLPIPNNMRDQNNIDYEATSGSIVGEALSLARGDGSDALKTGSVDWQQAEKNIGDATSALTAGTGGWAVNKLVSGLGKVTDKVVGPGTKDSLEQIAGIADNPFMTVMLKGPKFKSHHFAWRLAPKSQAETQTINNIRDTFKAKAYPELLALAAGGFFKYPYIVWPKFQPDGVISNTYAFKPCVITAINFNWTPNDRPGFYGDTQAPVECLMDIQLMEIELWKGGSSQTAGPSAQGFQNVPGDFNNLGRI